MTDEQWGILLNVINGQRQEPLPSGFIIDSPWLPGWCGISTLDYCSNDQLGFEANKKAS
jgi:uroporphyrinogen decarboxylase